MASRRVRRVPRLGPLAERSGQSTVEYALVLAAFLAAVLALGAVWEVAHEGGLQRLAEFAASHALGGSAPVGGIQDIVLY